MNPSSLQINIKRKTLWWSPTPNTKKLDKQKPESFTEGFVDLLTNASMHCYAKLVEPNRMFLEKMIWITIHITMMGLLCLALDSTLREFEKSPLITSLHDTIYPIDDVPFPAVSVCSNNRISKKAAQAYAQKLSSMDPKKRSSEYFLKMIHKLGYLYNIGGASDNETKEFQNFLNVYDKDGTSFNASKVMFNLTPKCGDILTKCQIGGEEISCVSPKTFQSGLTNNGYCCIFKLENREPGEQRVLENEPVGPAMGLVMELNTSTNDDFFHLINVNGFMVNIFYFTDYSDPASGGVKQRFIENGMEAYIRVMPQVFKSDETIRRYAPVTRNCLFPDESRQLFGKRYTFNNCITQCRVKSIAILCKCIPFYMPNYARNDTVYCNLHHLECLNRYKFKFSTVITVREEIPGLETEMEDALYCPECLPRCTYTQYEISKTALPISGNLSTSLQLIPTDQFARVRIYFYYYTTWLYLQTVRYPWFEILSNVGGLCGIFTGFSFAALFEIVYFFLRHLFFRIKEGLESDREAQNTKIIIYP